MIHEALSHVQYVTSEDRSVLSIAHLIYESFSLILLQIQCDYNVLQFVSKD